MKKKERGQNEMKQTRVREGSTMEHQGSVGDGINKTENTYFSQIYFMGI